MADSYSSHVKALHVHCAGMLQPGSSGETPNSGEGGPAGDRRSCNGILRLAPLEEALEVRRVDVIVQVRLAGKFLVKEKCPRFFLRRIQLITDTAWFGAGGPDQLAQHRRDFPLPTGGSFNHDVQNNRGSSHFFSLKVNLYVVCSQASRITGSRPR